MIAHTRPRWLSVLLVVWLLVATAPTFPTTAKAPAFDVRGRWEWTLSPSGCSGHCPSFVAIVTIKDQDPATGALTGTYNGPDKKGAIEGTVSGDRMTVKLGGGSGPGTANGTLALKGDRLTYEGSMPSAQSQVHGILVKPAVVRSADGGSRPSATLVVCDRDMTVPPDLAVLRCHALVTDASAQPDSRTPSGKVAWKAATGRLATGRCTLGAPIVGGVASCSVTLRATSTEIPIGTDVPVTASYAGDTLYAPSAGAPSLFGTTAGFEESDLRGPTCNPATTRKPNVGCGDPVNPATGDLSMAMTDVAIEGRGPVLEVVRTYSAHAAAAGQAGRFGVGWSDTYGARIDLGPEQAVTVRLGTGATVPFTAKGKGFRAPGWVTATLARGPGRTYVLTFADQRRLTFDRTGRLIEISDRAAEPITLGYAGDGSLASATDASGRMLSFTSDALGRVATVTDPVGRTVSYAYDPAGDLVAVTDVGGGRTTYAYDTRHRMTAITDPSGAVTRNAYDEQDRIAGQTDPLGNTLAFEYRGSFPDLMTLVTDGNGHRSGYEYRDGVLTSQTSGLDSDAPSTTSYVYDTRLALVTTIDADGQPWRTTRDARGNILTATDPLGRTTTATWNKANDPTSVTMPLGVTTRVEYDERGLVIKVTAAADTPAEAVTTLSRADLAHPADVTSITDPLGYATRFTYDQHGGVVGVVDPLGSAVAVTRDALGRSETFTDPLGAIISVVRDPFGDPTSITRPLGQTTLVAWDANRRQASITDALGHVTSTGYDAAGRPDALTMPDGAILGTGYDAIGDATSQEAADEAVSTLAYDAQRRPISWTDPLGNAWSMTWDLAGQPLTATDPLGQATGYGWDAAGQLVAIDHAGATANVTFTYDTDGQRLTMTDGTGTTSYTWDALGRLLSVTDGAGQTVATTYDATGNTTSITYPDGGVVERDHDALGRLIAVRDWLGHETTFTYDAAGRATGMRQGDGSTTVRTLDARGDLLGIEVTAAGAEQPLLSFDYERDALGRVESVSGSLDPGTVGVSRDPRGRLMAVGDESFEVDVADRLVGLRGYTLAYDAAGRLLTADGPDGSTTFATDAAGQRTSAATGTDQATLSTWDAAGRLTTIGSTSHTYDGDGLRMTSTLGDGSTSVFTWFRGGDLPILLGDGTSWFIQGPDGMPIEEIRADRSVQWLHADQAGSVRAVTDESGALTGTRTWDAYGLPVTSTGAAHTRIGFQGNYTDPDTGLQYLQARYYDPATGQFLSIDPIVLATRKPFAFANGDPLTFSDPSGTQSAITGGRVAQGMQSAAMLDALGLSLNGATCDVVIGDADGMQANLETMYAHHAAMERLRRDIAQYNLDASIEMMRGERPFPRPLGGMYADILRRQAQQDAAWKASIEHRLLEGIRAADAMSPGVQALAHKAVDSIFAGGVPWAGFMR